MAERYQELLARLGAWIGRWQSDPCFWRMALMRYLRRAFPRLEELEPMIGDFLEDSNERSQAWQREHQNPNKTPSYIWWNLGEILAIILATIWLGVTQWIESHWPSRKGGYQEPPAIASNVLISPSSDALPTPESCDLPIVEEPSLTDSTHFHSDSG